MKKDQKKPKDLSEKKSVKQPIIKKLIMIGVLALLLLIPLSMNQSIIEEREDRQKEAVQEVSSKWGQSQKLIGPILVVPYSYSEEVTTNNTTTKKPTSEDVKSAITAIQKNLNDQDNTPTTTISTREVKGEAYFLPEQLHINSNIDSEVRRRGIFDVALFSIDANLSGNFSTPDFEALKVSAENVLWDEAYVIVGITDLRGIQNETTIDWNGINYQFEPGTSTSDLFDSGIHSKVTLAAENTEPIAFNMDLRIQGNDTYTVAPLGKASTVAMTSSWTDPSFIGNVLPDERDINESGFSAKWNSTYLGRNYPQHWIYEYNGSRSSSQGERLSEISDSSFGVNLFIPVDFYSKANRAIKYGILFISLTFVIFFLFEVLNGLNIHPIQYLLVGLALSVFYLMLISLSEHIGFNAAYWSSALASISLITIYSSSILKNAKKGGVIFGLLFALYVYLYTLLHLQNYALVIGAIGLFIMLAAIMMITRNINWYEIANKKKE